MKLLLAWSILITGTTAAVLLLMLLATDARATDGYGTPLSSEHQCMAEALYFEARNQGTAGMVAVAAVVQNRVKSDRYPSTVCKVVRQAKMRGGQPILHQCQFSFYCDALPENPSEKEAWDVAMRIAGALTNTGFKVMGLEAATHYHTIRVQPSWSTVLALCGRVGDHLFYVDSVNTK